MSIYVWTEKYSVGFKSLDQDHQALFGLVNQLYEAMSQGKAKTILSETLNQLITYTRTHFKREEILFTTTNYPETKEHKQQHDLFIAKVTEFKKQFESGNQKISIELIKFLSDWLVNHILISDKKYTNHFRKYNVS